MGELLGFVDPEGEVYISDTYGWGFQCQLSHAKETPDSIPFATCPSLVCIPRSQDLSSVLPIIYAARSLAPFVVDKNVIFIPRPEQLLYPSPSRTIRSSDPLQNSNFFIRSVFPAYCPDSRGKNAPFRSHLC